MSTARQVPERIVVGVKRSSASRAAVLWAAREAKLRHGVLLVTHVDQPTAAATEFDGGATASHRLVVEYATVASDAEPSVAVGTLLLMGGISDELIRLSRSAVLLVVGIEQDTDRTTPTALGPIEVRVLIEAHCPVVLVPAAAGVTEGLWPAWSAGSLVPSEP